MGLWSSRTRSAARATGRCAGWPKPPPPGSGQCYCAGPSRSRGEARHVSGCRCLVSDFADYEAYNPAIAQVDAEDVFSVAEFDVMKNGMAPEAAIDKAFKQAEATS